MITVSKDGSGDFNTITEALCALGEHSTDPVTIFVKKGIYRERLELRRPYVTLVGEDREQTVVSYGLFARMPAKEGKLGTFRSYSVLIDTHDFTARDITFENSAGMGKDVGQAVALYVDGDRILFERCNIRGYQDTLFTGPLPPKEIEPNGFIGPKQFAPRLHGRHLYRDCFISGEVDFIFGSATAYFEDCTLFSRNIGSEINGYVTAASTPEGQAYGYVFCGCRFLSDCPPASVYLGRPWREYARTVILNSYLGEHIHPHGWHDWNKPHSGVFYAEYGNTGPGASLEHRPGWIQRLDAAASYHFARERVLHGTDGWNP